MLKNKKYCKLKFCSNYTFQNACREYCINDTKKKGGLVVDKHPIGPFKQEGTWKTRSGQGERTDLVEAKKAICKKTKWRDVLMDDDLVEPCAKYLKWAKEVYDHRPLDIEPRELEQGLQPWQKELIDHLAKPVVTRRIFWVWSSEHDTGKSTFKHYLETRGYDIVEGTLEYHNLLSAYDGNAIIWFDFAKTSLGTINEKFENLRNHVLEKVSNVGMQLSTKYHVVRKYVKAHIVVTSNDPPPFDALPKRIVEIKVTPLPKLYLTAEEKADYDQYSEEELRQLLADDTEEFSPAPPPTLTRAVASVRPPVDSPLREGDVPGTPTSSELEIESAQEEESS